MRLRYSELNLLGGSRDDDLAEDALLESEKHVGAADEEGRGVAGKLVVHRARGEAAGRGAVATTAAAAAAVGDQGAFVEDFERFCPKKQANNEVAFYLPIRTTEEQNCQQVVFLR